MNRIYFALITLSLMTACSASTYSAPPAKLSSTDSPVLKKLYKHYNEWRGVRYLEGGMSKQGIDCSGFVHLAYKHKLNKRIPRSTKRMSNAGSVIKRANLRPGDVVFFKTGWKVRHVGIYVNNGEFIHASSSRGVMKSKLKNPYWADAFWMARRY